MSEPTDPKKPATPAPVEPPKRDRAAEAAALAELEALEAGSAAGDGEGTPAVAEGLARTGAAADAVEAKATAKAEARADVAAAKPAAPVAAKPAAPVAAKPAAPVAAKAAAAKAADLDRIPLPPPWYKTLRADPPAHIRAALGIGLIALLLLLWWFVTRGADPTARIVSPSKLPSPGEVFGAFGKLMEADFLNNLIDSLLRVFKGIVLAAIVGIVVGVLAGANRGVGSALEPLVIFLRSVPMGALIPLTLLLFGDGEKQKSMFIFLAVVPFVFSDTVKAVSIVPERYVETAQTLGASRFQIIYKVLVPLALPDIITSLRFLLGLALGYIMLVEVVNTPLGLGTMLNTSQRLGMSERIYLLLFLIAFVAFGLDYLLRTLQRGLFSWRRDL